MRTCSDFAWPRSKGLNVTEKVHEDIRKRAVETDNTMEEYVEYLLAKDKVAKEAATSWKNMLKGI